jgi:hypothetical protein
MTIYTISEKTEYFIYGVIQTLTYLKKCNVKTLWDFLEDHYGGDFKGEFIIGVKIMNDFEITDKLYKIVNDDEYVELSKEEKDKADDVEIVEILGGEPAIKENFY